MPEYSSYPQNVGPEKQNNKTAEKNSVLPLTKNTEENESDVFELPPRSRVHRRRKEREAENKRKNELRAKKERMKFPLVRILFILFFFIVAATITYPIWIEML